MRNRIERQREIIDFTLSRLSRRKGRQLAILIVYSGAVFLLASVMFLVFALRTEAILLLRQAPELVVQRLSAGRHDLMPESYFDAVRSIRGARNVTQRLWGYYFDPSSRANYTLMAPESVSSGDGAAIIGDGVSRANSAYPGDILTIRGHDGRLVNLAVTRVLSPDSQILSSDLILISRKDFMAIFSIPPGFSTDLTLTAENAGELPLLAAAIRNLLPDARLISRQDVLKTYAGMFDWRRGFILLVLSASALALAMIAMDRAFGLSAEDKKEIGILKAIGWRTSDVLLMKFWEGAVISLSAFISGILLAYAHVFLLHPVLFAPVLKGWSVLYPEFRLTPFISPVQMALLFILTVIPYIAATVAPSWRPAAIDPDAVLRA